MTSYLPSEIIYNYPASVVSKLRTDGNRAQETCKSYLPSANDEHHWKPQKTTQIPGGFSVTVSKRTEFPNNKKLPAAFRAEVVLPTWLTPEIWLETFYWRRKHWDHSVDPRTQIIWFEQDSGKKEGTTVSIDVTKPAAGGMISSRYLCNISRYSYFNNGSLFMFCGTKNNHDEEAIKSLEAKVGSLKSLVKADLHDSGSVLEKHGEGWKYYYIIHVSLGGWLPTSLIEGEHELARHRGLEARDEMADKLTFPFATFLFRFLFLATMVSQMTGYIQEWLHWTTEHYGPKQ